jgi:hypothetical protein
LGAAFPEIPNIPINKLKSLQKHKQPQGDAMALPRLEPTKAMKQISKCIVMGCYLIWKYAFFEEHF